MYIIIITLFFAVHTAILSYFLVYRNIKTFKTLRKINKMSYHYAMQLIKEEKYDYFDANDPYKWCMKKIPTYMNVIWSFDDISVENILTYEQIDKFREVLGYDFLIKEYPNAK